MILSSPLHESRNFLFSFLLWMRNGKRRKKFLYFDLLVICFAFGERRLKALGGSLRNRNGLYSLNVELEWGNLWDRWLFVSDVTRPTKGRFEACILSHENSFNLRIIRILLTIFSKSMLLVAHVSMVEFLELKPNSGNPEKISVQFLSFKISWKIIVSKLPNWLQISNFVD